MIFYARRKTRPTGFLTLRFLEWRTDS